MGPHGKLNRLPGVFAWIGTVLAIATVALILPSYFHFIGSRPGSFPPEPLHGSIGPVDLSTPLFALLYATIAAAVWGIARKPMVLLRGMQAYFILLVLRMITLFAFTLEPPPELIDLIDPATQLFYPGKEPFRKDLFFSGHTATVALLALAMPWRIGGLLLWLVMLLIGLAVIAQHVHWTVDVVAAPLFAWLAWRASAVTLRYSVPGPINSASA